MKKNSKISSKELKRILKLKSKENEIFNLGYNNIAGVDEAGRGPLAGPLVVAAVIAPSKLLIKGVNDSKKISEKERILIYNQLLENENVKYAVEIVDNVMIDNLNIYQATLYAFQKVISKLLIKPDFVLFDGRAKPKIDIKSESIISGDSLCYSIALASIIAKVTRDNLMMELHKKYPLYGFNKHKGYGTKNHIKNLLKYGPCAIHRKTYEPVKMFFISK